MKTQHIRHCIITALVLGGFAVPTVAADARRGVTDTEIVIGKYTDLFFDAANDHGGIRGRKSKCLAEDNQYQVPRSVQAAHQLMNRDDVFVMVASASTPPDQL